MAISGNTRIEQWELVEPFEIARGTMTRLPVVVLTLTDENGHVGQAEAAGVDYDGETPALITQQIGAFMLTLAELMPNGASTTSAIESLQRLMPPGGARNALDCALWDLRAKQTGVPVWETAGLTAWRPLTTVYTLGLGSEDDTRRKARDARRYPLLKLKCDSTRHVDVVRVVREEHPTARIAVDANQAWTRELLEQILPALQALRVEMVEQPVKRGEDAQLSGLRSPIPLAADESCTDTRSIVKLAPYYRYLNIKLDKCGGLTEALAMGREAKARDLELMVGNMCGTSLGMAPAFVIGQQCTWVDIDGPLLQKEDRAHAMRFENGVVQPPESALWG